MEVQSKVCDLILGTYGRLPWPHYGRDRVVRALDRQARREWNGPRVIARRGLRIETDLKVDDVGWTLYSYGCLDYWDERMIKKLLHPGAVCFDIGAHIGYYSLLMSRWVGPSGKVISFEPMPYTYSFLILNLERNRAHNVAPKQIAVGDTAGYVQMAAADNRRLGWSSVTEFGETKVSCTSVDAEIEASHLKAVDFIKIDVEGYELHVLRGCEQTIKQLQPKIMFEVNERALRQHSADLEALEDFFLSHNYSLFRATSEGLIPIRSRPFGSFFNIFALPLSKLGGNR